MTEEKQTKETVSTPAAAENSVAVSATATGGAETKVDGAAKTAVVKRKKKTAVARQVSLGRAYVKSTYNNTLVTLTDQNGNVLSWASAGQCGFKGPKKSTPYAATVIVKNVCEKARKYGLKEVSVFVRGIGGGREAAIRALNANGLIVSGIKDITPIPHNGCRAKKPRRV